MPENADFRTLAMAFIVLLTAWTAFISYLFGVLEQISRSTPLREGFFVYFMTGFYSAFAWIVVLMVFRFAVPEMDFKHFLIFTPLVPPLAGTIVCFLRFRRV